MFQPARRYHQFAPRRAAKAVQNDFSPSATLKHIILITDGGENCGDDPCLFIRRLMQLRDDFKIDVIGITVDINAYSQLKCIALAGKGEYYNVRTPEDFKIKFKHERNVENEVHSHRERSKKVFLHCQMGNWSESFTGSWRKEGTTGSAKPCGIPSLPVSCSSITQQKNYCVNCAATANCGKCADLKQNESD